MSQCKWVDIYCDGNEKIGFGHIRRSSTLAIQLKKDGICVRIIGLSEQARKMLPAAEESKRIAAVVIFDSPYEIDDLIKTAHQRGQTTLTLDWFGKMVPDVNIAVYPHQAVLAKHQSYTGFEFIMVRDEIRCLLKTKPTEDARHVLVLLGGADVQGQGHMVSRQLCELGLEVTLIQGPLAKNTKKDERFSVLVNPTELPELLNSCDWVVTNAGGCFFESLFLGKAALVLPQSANEKKIALYAEEKGAALGVGLDEVQRYQYDEILTVGKRGEKLVDGNGSERISEIVQDLL